MSRSLLIDVGAGTMDILWHDTESSLHFKVVVPSPVRVLGDEITATTGDLVVTGGEMGGGPVSRALIERAKTNRVAMTQSAAATIHHDLDRVTRHGIEIVEVEASSPLRSSVDATTITLADIDALRIGQLLDWMGISETPDVIGVCAQDHGTPPDGVSHLDHRHTLFEEHLRRSPDLRDLCFRADELPSTFNRLTTMAEDASRIGSGTAEVFVMDSGMAAMVGARLDPRCAAAERIIVLDIATSHTVAAAYDPDGLCGFVEYHTKDLDRARLDDVLVELAAGRLSHADVLAAGGHGALTRRAVGGMSAVDLIVATGPKRRLLEGSRHPIAWGAPLGDTMMTGTAGLLVSIGYRHGVEAELTDICVHP